MRPRLPATENATCCNPFVRTALIVTAVVMCSGVVVARNADRISMLDAVRAAALQPGDRLLGVDPKVTRRLAGELVDLPATGFSQEDLETRLDALGLVVVEFPGRRAYVTTPAAQFLNAGLASLLQAERSDLGAELARVAQACTEALAQEPDNPQLFYLKGLLERLTRNGAKMSALLEKLDRLGEQSREDADKEKAGAKNDDLRTQALLDCMTCWDDLRETFLADYTKCRQAGLSVELAPVLGATAWTCTEFLNAFGRLRDHRAPDAHTLISRESADQWLQSIEFLTAWHTAAVRRSDELVALAVPLFEADRHEQARSALQSALELNPGALKAQAFLSWIRTRRLQAQLREREQRATARYVRLAADALRAGAADLARALRDAERMQDLQMLDTLCKDVGIEFSDDVADLRPPQTRIGAVLTVVGNGVGTASWECRSLTVTLEPRTQSGARYDVYANGRHVDWDSPAYEPLLQALTWVDAFSDGGLSQYRVTIRHALPPTMEDAESLGAACAAAAFSALYQLPADSATAVVGGIRGYGDVVGVGEIVERIRAARAAGVSTIIVPAENETELALLSDEDCTAIHIRVAERAADMIPYAVVGVGGAHLADRQAQLYRAACLYEQLTLLPEADAAYRTLDGLTSNDYSCRRALDRLASCRFEPVPCPAWLRANEAVSGRQSGVELPSVSADTGGDLGDRGQDLRSAAAQISRIAQTLYRTPDRAQDAAVLADLAAAMDPRNPALLLLKGLQRAGTETAEPVAGTMPARDFEELLLRLAEQYGRLKRAVNRAFADACYLLVLDHVNADSPDALRALARCRSPETTTLGAAVQAFAEALRDEREESAPPERTARMLVPPPLPAAPVLSAQDAQATDLAGETHEASDDRPHEGQSDRLDGPWWYLWLETTGRKARIIDFENDFLCRELILGTRYVVLPAHQSRQTVRNGGTTCDVSMHNRTDQFVVQEQGGGRRSITFSQDPDLPSRFNAYLVDGGRRIPTGGYAIVRYEGR